MTNMLLYDFIQSEEYTLKKLVDDYWKSKQDDYQGIIFHEYNDDFLKATYWQRKKRKEYKYNIEKEEFEEIEEEIVIVADFDILIREKKLLIFGNKQMAQRIITLIGVISKNLYSITEYVVDIQRLVNSICQNESIDLLKMKLKDIVLAEGLMVDCNVDLKNQNDPVSIVRKYIDNIIVMTFSFQKITANITVYKTGKVSISKIVEDDKDEIIQKIIQITC